MENLKFTLFSIIVLAVLVFIGYWGFSTIQSGSSNVNNQRLVELTKENQDLTNKSSTLLNQVAVLQAQVDEMTQAAQKVSKAKVTSTATLKYQTLINNLQKIVSAKVLIKKGSRGTRVGTVQTFLNLYNKTSNRIDNDFGPSMEKAVKKFQKDQHLSADGRIGSGTLSRMIDWLKKK